MTKTRIWIWVLLSSTAVFLIFYTELFLYPWSSFLAALRASKPGVALFYVTPNQFAQAILVLTEARMPTELSESIAVIADVAAATGLGIFLDRVRRRHATASIAIFLLITAVADLAVYYYDYPITR